jgi:diguanylate cyclase
MTLLIEAAVAVTAASAGAAAGWCLRRRAEPSSRDVSPAQAPVSAEMANDAARSRQVAKELLAQVHGLTAKVATQVGEHNQRVQAINDQLASGDNDLQAITSAVTRLVEANAWMQQQLDSAESKLESQARLIEAHVNEARTDALTGIANRRAFNEELQRCCDLFRLEGIPSCVLMLDVDYFKKFNDTHGHKAGDEVLRHVAQQLRQAAGASGVVCRYGGEEFAVIFSGLDGAQAINAAETCRAAIGEHSIRYEGQSLQVSASAGLAQFIERDTLESVVERADEALYASKRGGRNCGHWKNGETFVPFVTAPAASPNTPAPASTDLSVLFGPALLDAESGLSTRDALRDDLQRRLASLQREPQPLSLLVVQIDQFAEWRERGGEKEVGAVLRAVGLAVRGISRNMDHAARFEEDSFAIALHGAGLSTAVEVAQRLRASLVVSRPVLAGKPKEITLSIGVCEALAGDDSSRFLLRAQAAQKTAATRGGDRVATHDGGEIRLVEEAGMPA